jgi:hypothetical protein
MAPKIQLAPHTWPNGNWSLEEQQFNGQMTMAPVANRRQSQRQLAIGTPRVRTALAKVSSVRGETLWFCGRVADR